MSFSQVTRRRDFLSGTIAFLVAPTVAETAARFDATVGKGGYSSIQEALNAAPSNSTKTFRILIRRGRWHEKLTVDKPFIHLIGEDRRRSVISFDAYAGQLSPDGQPWGTSRTATVIIRATNFSASNLTIENAFDHLAFVRRTREEASAGNGAQAVALMLDANSDRALVENCDLVGYQDTLFANAGRSLFRRCKISGTVDFIFGAGNAVFDRCEIVSRFRSETGKQGYVAAPSTLVDQEYGLTFIGCRLTREKGVAANSVSLGRAWRPTTTFADGRYGNPKAVGKAVFLHCWMDEHIEKVGWDAMTYGARDGSRVRLEPKEARFSEFGSRGPGAQINTDRPLLSEEQVRRFEVRNILGDWQP